MDVKFEPQKYITRDSREIIFRLIKSSDAETYLDFCHQVPEDSTHTMRYQGMIFPDLLETQNRLQIQYDDLIILNIGAFFGEKLIGQFNLRPYIANHPWVKHVAQFGMMILKEFWGQDIGKKMLELPEPHAAKFNVTRIEATVRSKNSRGLNLYLHNGYKIEGRRSKSAWIEHELVDEYYISKILDDKLLNWKPAILKTDRFILRPLQISDAESIFEYAKNPNVCETTLWQTHQSIYDTLKYIQDYAFKYYRDGVPEPYGITLKSQPDKIIGTVGCFWVSEKNKCMELNYAISEDYWDQGIAAEAAVAVLNYCFQNFDVKRIQARCKAENINSSRVMEKMGMIFEGTLKASEFHADQFWDMHYYAVMYSKNN